MNNRSVYLIIVLLTAMILILGVSLTVRVYSKPTIAHKTVMLSLIKKFPEPSVRIMPLGDSITAGIGSIGRGGYRVTLWNDCKAVGWNIDFVGSQQSGPDSLPERSDEGHPGWRIDQLSRYVVGWLKTYQPQIILLHIGTNDIIQDHSLNTAPDRLSNLINQITTTLPTATVIVAQIIPLRDPVLNAKVVKYNSAIPVVVQHMAAQDKHVTYVDMYHVVPSSDLPDRIHPNNSGYTLMAGVWYQALKSILNA
jgi:lysophospholipase L1-like esterase